MAQTMLAFTSLAAFSGDPLSITVRGGTVRVGVKTDIVASNGVIHVVDTVLVPPTSTQ
jgi:uncharacterized surface protein with fasciclin (FAS1) repeats